MMEVFSGLRLVALLPARDRKSLSPVPSLKNLGEVSTQLGQIKQTQLQWDLL